MTKTPAKVPYPTPGEILEEEFLKPFGITHYRLAKQIGVQQRRVDEIVNGTRSITPDTALRLSRFFAPTLKENPTEAQVVSHRLMLRAGMIRQHAAGIYNWLPLGTRVLQNVARIVREEQDAAGALEIIMPTIQSGDLWRESGRYDDYGPEMLRIKDRHERDFVIQVHKDFQYEGPMYYAWTSQ